MADRNECSISPVSALFANKISQFSGNEVHPVLEILTCDLPFGKVRQFENRILIQVYKEHYA